MEQHQQSMDQCFWQVIALIPAGRVASYGDIARQAGFPGAARQVGRALRKLPAKTRVPWHRVLAADGKIALPEQSSAARLQRERLEAEGVVFKGNGKVDIKKFRWQPGCDDP